MKKETRTIAISLTNWKKLSRLKIKEGLRGFDELMTFLLGKKWGNNGSK